MNYLYRFAFGLLLGVLMGLTLEAKAQHECQGGHNCNDDVVNVGQPSGDRFLALSNSLGDVDVSGCIITKQWSVVVFAKQGYEYDPWCLAGILDENGKYIEAATMRCTDKETAKIYGEDCTVVLNFEPAEPQGLVRDDDWDWEEKYLAQQQEIEMVREESASRVAATTRKQSVLEAKLDADADRRARARAARDEILNKGSE